MNSRPRARLLAVALLLFGAASVLPPDALAQTAKRFRIGVVNTALAANAPMVEGLRAGLKQLGIEEGRDVSFYIRFTRGDVKAVSTEEGVQAVALVAKILKGAKPREVPIEGARKLVFAINKETAGAMGITVSPELLKRADRVVE